MNAETVARTIQLILAPVVMVTACALILNGILSRYAAVNDRLRALSRERFEVLQGGAQAVLAAERLGAIDSQVPLLIRHHNLLHDGVLAVYLTIGVYISNMFVIAIAAVSGTAWMATAALVIFLAGTGVLLFAVVLTALEIRTSHQAVQSEAAWVAGLGKQI